MKKQILSVLLTMSLMLGSIPAFSAHAQTDEKLLELLSQSLNDEGVQCSVKIPDGLSGVLIGAAYSGGSLSGAVTEQVDGKGREIQVTVPAKEGDMIKIMLWDGIKSMKPIAGYLELGIEAPAEENVRITEKLNDDWLFAKAKSVSVSENDIISKSASEFDSAGWTQVTLPHTWNAQDGSDGGSNYDRTRAWYRKEFHISTDLSGKKLYLEFGGAGTAAELYINKVHVPYSNSDIYGNGSAPEYAHKGGFSAFRFDITDYVRLGEDNIAAVMVDNTKTAEIAPLDGDFNCQGGLYRGVSITAVDPVHADMNDYGSNGLYLTPQKVTAVSDNSNTDFYLNARTKIVNDSDSARTVTITAELCEPSSYDVPDNEYIRKHLRFSPADMYTLGGKTVHGFEAKTVTLGAGETFDYDKTITVTKPRLWNGLRDPYRYEVKLKVEENGETVDLLKDYVGFKYINMPRPEKDASGNITGGGFYLNGREYTLRGANKHQDWGRGTAAKGYAITKTEMASDAGIMYELGMNSVRLAHYQHSNDEIELYDKLGILVWSELGLVDDMIAQSAESYDAFVNVSKSQLTELIKQQYNHPSVFIWGLSNELRREEDDSLNVVDGTDMVVPSGADLFEKLNTTAKSLDAVRPTTYAAFSLYGRSTDWDSDTLAMNLYPYWYTDHAAKYHGGNTSMTGEMKYYFGLPGKDGNIKPMGISEYGASAVIGYNRAYNSDGTVTHPGGSSYTTTYQTYVHEKVYNEIVNELPWVWCSYVWQLFDSASDKKASLLKGTNDKGLVSYDHTSKKDSYYFYKANWNDIEPFAHIVNADRTEFTTGTTIIRAYSNCDKLQLYLNGKPYGEPITDVNASDGVADGLHIFMWYAVPLLEITEIEVKGINGTNEVCSSVDTTGKVTFTTDSPADDAGIALNKSTYPLVVGNKSKTDFSQWQTKGSSVTLTPIISSSAYTASDIKWTSSNAEVASVNTAGKVQGLTTGTTDITAALPNGNKAVCRIVVIDNITRSTVQTIELNADELTLSKGKTAELVPIIYPKDVFDNGALNTSVTWSTSDASVASVDSNGTVTAVSSGTAVITVTSADIGRTAECFVTVTDTDTAMPAVEISGEKTEMTVGDTMTLSADGYTNDELIWKSENSFVADVDENGVVTAYSSSDKAKLIDNPDYDGSTDGLNSSPKKQVIENGKASYESGTVNIIATTKNGGVKGVYPISVKNAPIKVQSVHIGAGDINIAKGSTKTVTAAIAPAALFEENVAWSGDNESVAAVTSDGRSIEGLNQARITANSAGTAVITAEYGGKSDTITVTVTENAVKVSNIELSDKTIELDEVVVLEPQITENAENKELIWLCTDRNIVSVDNDGTIQGIGEGTAEVYAVAADSVTDSAALDTLIKSRTLDSAALAEIEALTYGKCTVTVSKSSIYLRNLHIPEETVTDSSVNLLWNKSSDLDTTELAQFEIYRDGVKIDTTNAIGYTAEGLIADREYTFTVKAANSEQETLKEQSVIVKTKPQSEIINVLDYGAIGDGRHTDTYAIQKAIDECPENGTVYLPEGYVFYSGALFLKSDMTFKVDGILLGSMDAKDYPLMITRWEGWRKLYQTADAWDNTTADVPENHYPHSSLINLGVYDEGMVGHAGPYNIKNVTICGKGQINGNGYKLAYTEGSNHKTGDGGLPVPMSPASDDTIRGRLITTHNAQNVYVKDVTLAFGPSWTVNAIYSDHMTFDGLDIISQAKCTTGAADNGCILNGDGIDPDSSTNVNIFNVEFANGDDAVAVKSGRNKEGNELKKPSGYIRITDCDIKMGKGGMAIGSEAAAGVHNILIQNIKAADMTHGAIWLKSRPGRGGIDEDIVVRDIKTTSRGVYVSFTGNSGANLASEPARYRYLTFENCRCNNSFTIEGTKDSYIEHVTIRGGTNGKTINYGRHFAIWDNPKDNWTVGSTCEDINFYTTGQFEDTALAFKSNAGMVREIDNENRILTVIDIAAPADITNEITSTLGGVQEYTFYNGTDIIGESEAVSDGNILRVTSEDKEHTADYVIRTAESDIAFNDTGIKLKSGASYVTEVREHSICVKEGTLPEQIIGEIESVYGFEQTYSIDAESDDSPVTEENILTVISNNEESTKSYSIRIVRIWDLTDPSASQAKMSEAAGSEINYKDVIIHSDSASDYINTSVGVHFNGKSPAQNRYIAFTPESCGILTVTARRAFSNAALYYASNTSFSGGKQIAGLSNNASWADGDISVTAGETCYLYCVNSGMEIRSLMLTPAE